MRHPKAIDWETKLLRIFNRIDHYLEENYGDIYRPHPVRANRKSTGNPEDDGLFRVGASFSAGFGSEKGAGYLVRIEFMTLEDVDANIRNRIEEEVASMLRKELPGEFPGKDLRVERDGNTYKIFGNLKLGKA